MPDFDIVFLGEVLPGQEKQQVQERLGARFNVTGERLEQLFSGNPLVVRRGVDEKTAQALSELFTSCGARCRIVPGGDNAPAVPGGAVAGKTEWHKTPAGDLQWRRLDKAARTAKLKELFGAIGLHEFDTLPVKAKRQIRAAVQWEREPILAALDRSVFKSWKDPVVFGNEALCFGAGLFIKKPTSMAYDELAKAKIVCSLGELTISVGAEALVFAEDGKKLNEAFKAFQSCLLNEPGTNASDDTKRAGVPRTPDQNHPILTAEQRSQTWSELDVQGKKAALFALLRSFVELQDPDQIPEKRREKVMRAVNFERGTILAIVGTGSFLDAGYTALFGLKSLFTPAKTFAYTDLAAAAISINEGSLYLNEVTVFLVPEGAGEMMAETFERLKLLLGGEHLGAVLPDDSSGAGAEASADVGGDGAGCRVADRVPLPRQDFMAIAGLVPHRDTDGIDSWWFKEQHREYRNCPLARGEKIYGVNGYLVFTSHKVSVQSPGCTASIRYPELLARPLRWEKDALIFGPDCKSHFHDGYPLEELVVQLRMLGELSVELPPAAQLSAEDEQSEATALARLRPDPDRQFPPTGPVARARLSFDEVADQLAKHPMERRLFTEPFIPPGPLWPFIESGMLERDEVIVGLLRCSLARSSNRAVLFTDRALLINGCQGVARVSYAQLAAGPVMVYRTWKIKLAGQWLLHVPGLPIDRVLDLLQAIRLAVVLPGGAAVNVAQRNPWRNLATAVAASLKQLGDSCPIYQAGSPAGKSFCAAARVPAGQQIWAIIDTSVRHDAGIVIGPDGIVIKVPGSDTLVLSWKDFGEVGFNPLQPMYVQAGGRDRPSLLLPVQHGNSDAHLQLCEMLNKIKYFIMNRQPVRLPEGGSFISCHCCGSFNIDLGEQRQGFAWGSATVGFLGSVLAGASGIAGGVAYLMGQSNRQEQIRFRCRDCSVVWESDAVR